MLVGKSEDSVKNHSKIIKEKKESKEHLTAEMNMGQSSAENSGGKHATAGHVLFGSEDILPFRQSLNSPNLNFNRNCSVRSVAEL